MRRIIGIVLNNPESLSTVRSSIKPDEVPIGVPRTIYNRMCELDDKGEEINATSVTLSFMGDEKFVDDGGVYYILDAEMNLYAPGGIIPCINAIRKKSCEEKLFSVSLYISAAIKDGKVGLPEILSHVEHELFDISAQTVESKWSSLGEIVADNLKSVLDGSRYDDSRLIKTGYTDLDAIFFGLRPGTLTIIGGRPGMGKTALGLNILVNVAIKKNIPCAMFSLEMKKRELCDRVHSMIGSINGTVIQSGNFSRNEKERYVEVSESLATNTTLHIIDIGNMEIQAIRSEAKKIQKQQGIKLIVIDYLQLARSERKTNQSQQDEISDVSGSLKALAKEMDIPIIAIAQVNRDNTQRPDKRPALSDLRGSGSIEQDADTVMFVHREDYYKPSEPKTNEAEIIIAKQRAGSTGVVKLRWTDEYTRFDNLTDDKFLGVPIDYERFTRNDDIPW